MFEVVWKSGDVTWLPYYQIKHLQSLDAYLELMGVDDASKLTSGKGKPPQDDPQVHLGALSFASPFSPSQQLLLPSQPNTIPSHCLASPVFLRLLDINNPFSFLSTYPSFSESVADFHTLLSAIFRFIDSMPKEIKHPWLKRLNDTEFILDRPESLNPIVIHAGQILKFINFDQSLRDGRSIPDLTGIPLGYDDFARAFNDGRRRNDKREMSLVLTDTSTGDQHIIRSRHPIALRDFAITPVQCGLPAPSTSLDDPNAIIAREYAINQAKQAARRREAIQERIDKQLVPFQKNIRRHSNNPPHHSGTHARKRNTARNFEHHPRPEATQ